MTLQTAKHRRVQALTKARADRILVKPADHHSCVHLPEEGTVADYLLEALCHGCQVEELEAETGWSKSTVLVNLYKVAKKTGVGIRRRANILHLLLPEGAKHMYPRPRVVATESTSRTDGNFTIITLATH